MFYGVITHQRVIPQWKTRVTCVLRVQSYDLRERRSILTCEYFALSRLDLFTFQGFILFLCEFSSLIVATILRILIFKIDIHGVSPQK